MPRGTATTTSHGDRLLQETHPFQSDKTRNGFRKTAEIPVKRTHSPIMTPSSLASDSESDADDTGDDDEDSSATEHPASPDAEPDVSALPAPTHGRRLAGHQGRQYSDAVSDDEDNGDDADEVDDNDQTQSNNAHHDILMAGTRQVPVNVDSDEDDDYADVENVSDGEDSVGHIDDQAFLRFAEQDLIKEYEDVEQRQTANIVFAGLSDMDIDEDEALARRLNLHSGDYPNETDLLDINLDEDPFIGLTSNESLYNDMLQDAELAIWRMPHTERKDSDTSATTQKRVRFEEVESRASSDSDSEEEAVDFPDLFATEDDPLLKQRLAFANAREAVLAGHASGDNESVYDFDGEEEKMAFELDEDSSSDDYESSYDSEDEGDTTDEETAEEQIARMREMKKALGKPSISNPATPVPAKKVVRKAVRTPESSKPPASRSSKGPATGTFVLDPTRASMSANAAGTKIQVRPPTRPLDKDKKFWERAKSVNNSRHGSPQSQSYLTIASPVANDVPSRPFTAQSTLGSMFDGKLDIIRNNDVNGIADDIYPAMMPPTERPLARTHDAEISDDEMPDVDMSDFISMDYSDSDSEQNLAGADGTSDADVFSTLPSDNDHFTGGNGLLEHLSQCRGIVGSFRRNQHHAKHVSSLASHPAKRASASEYNALQKGRRAAGNSPMTPVRKSRLSQDLTSSGGIRKTASSPLTTQRPRSRGNSIGMKNTALKQTLSSYPLNASFS